MKKSAIVYVNRDVRQKALDFVKGNLRSGIWSLATLYFVIKAIGITIPLSYATPVAITLMLLLLTETYENTRKKASIIVHEKQSDADEYFFNFLNTYKPKEAVFLQLSGRKVENLVEKIIDQGGRVALCLQKPETVKKVSEYQYLRIIQDIHSLAGTLPRSLWDKLDIYLFEAPVSVKAIQIDNELLLIGFYVYEYEKKTGETKIWGHNVLGFQVSKDSPEFVKCKDLIQRVRDKNTLGNSSCKLDVLITKYPKKY